MATKQSTADFLLEQLSSAGYIRYRKMFGEYALYCNEKVIGFICDDKLYVKPTKAGKEFIGTVEEAPAYPGSKLYYYIGAEYWDDAEWMKELVLKTAEELPPPKIKK